MREETANWLQPMLEEGGKRGIELIVETTSNPPLPTTDSEDVEPLYGPGRRPVAMTPAIDWIRYGQRLRHELGWDSTYPENPEQVNT